MNMNYTEVNREELLVALAECYEHDPRQFVALTRQTVDSCLVREIVAELRNQGYVEEQIRGVIRLTARGYSSYKKQSLSVAYMS
jgi:predicted transcriptional regulator